jgi:hypothetical protein
MRESAAPRRQHRSTRLLAAAIALTLLAGFALVSGAFGQAQSHVSDALHSYQQARSVPPATKDGLASSALRDTVARLAAGKAAPAGIDIVHRDDVRVEILHSMSAPDLRSLVARLGGSRLRQVDGQTAEAIVPVAMLDELESDTGVSFVRPPLVVGAPQDDPALGAAVFKPLAGGVLGEHVAKTNAANWHQNGRTGAGVRVGIIDNFSASHWNAAIASGDLPNPSGTFCMHNGVACDIWSTDPGSHGVGVAEIIYDMAPSAQLYIAQPSHSSAADVLAAVNYFQSQGVRIINRSLAGELDGPGNGTGPLASIADQAVAKGMTWFQSAGNSGGPNDAGIGGYWRGSWADTDNDGWIDFTPGDEGQGFYCGFTMGLRWSDWGPAAGRTDYDLYVYDDPNFTVLEWSSTDRQQTGAPPLEHISNSTAGICDFVGDVDFFAIQRQNAGSGTAGDVLEFLTNSAGLEYWSNPYSANQPFADSANPGVVTVGAVDPAAGTTIANYSAWGPTNDGRIKPDISASTCVKTVTTGTGCFNGTSGATPNAAGAGALVAGANPAAGPVDVRNFLLTQAVTDRGTAGPDNAYGAGELILPLLQPAPPPPPPPAPPAPPRNPQAGDRRKPTARALLSKGVRGRKVKLYYRVFDNRGQTRELVQVNRGRKVVWRLRTRFATTGARGKVYYVSWRSPRARGEKKPSYRFCVRAYDRAGNRSALSCAAIRLRTPG